MNFMFLLITNNQSTNTQYLYVFLECLIITPLLFVAFHSNSATIAP